MTAEANCPPAISLTLHELECFPERQRAVAKTWADHFDVWSEQRERFMLHYLTHTSSTRCWCVVLHSDTSVPRPTVARFGRQLQYFDGQLISAVLFSEKQKVPVQAPSASRALKLAHRLITGNSAEALLTSFCKHARSLAVDESRLSIQPLINATLGATTQEGRNKRFYGPRNRFYITCIGANLKRFCQSLDQELLHAVRSVQCPSAKLYNWLAQGDRQRRLQALRAQPVLIPLLVIGEGMPWPQIAHGLLENCPWPDLQEFSGSLDYDSKRDGAGFAGVAVDRGMPLNQVLAWLLGAPLSAIRYIGQQRVYDTGSALTRLNLEGLEGGWFDLVAGARLGNRRPKTKAQWRSFYLFRSKIPWQLLQSLRDMNNLLGGCPTEWTDPAWPSMTAKLVDLRELFDNLDRAGCRAAMDTKGRLLAFLGSLNFRQLSNLIDAFHIALQDIRTKLDREIPPEPSDSFTQWPTLLLNGVPIRCVETGLQIVELCCPADLDREHSSLGHCIDTYDYRAYLGDCRLLSIRSGERPLASFELVLRAHRNEHLTGQWTLKNLSLVQLRDHENETPNAQSSVYKTFEWFFASVRGGLIPVNLEWPNLAQKMARYADTDSMFRIRFGEEVITWVNSIMTEEF
ncbi:hypothetical protein [Pseudomonas syringae group sp. J309-1]|uniref:hypothetical protein n=1 Tax=Pseudomonas syringae group sp. J309-1 TaxID=3079588 RepID=UPI00290C411B|nr:hypothetical protein [Pseudomonas syringae group sp. J309-1]MDU8358497.1 hypothetical protein [Pseudomonas syringae group sp. J309-1]